MSGAGTVAGALLALTFAWAALAKLRRRDATAVAFARLGVPAPGAAAVAVPAVELAVGALLIAAPAYGGRAALALLAAFTAFLAVRLRAGADVACGCFGQAAATPVTAATLARNGLLGALAAVTLLDPSPVAPALPTVVVVTTAAAVGGTAIALYELRLRTGRLWDNRLGAGPEARL